jgi:hypothetical protein
MWFLLDGRMWAIRRGNRRLDAAGRGILAAGRRNHTLWHCINLDGFHARHSFAVRLSVSAATHFPPRARCFAELLFSGLQSAETTLVISHTVWRPRIYGRGKTMDHLGQTLRNFIAASR